MNKKRPIMIIAAMENSELNILKDEAENITEVQEKTCKFYEIQMYGYPVILCCSKIGCIQASAAITLAIMKYHPIAIINEGLAGAHGKDIRKHDLVIGTEIVNIHSIRTPKCKESEGVNPLNWELITFITGEDDKMKIEKANESLVKCVRNIETEYTKGKVVYGRIGSGDVWNNEADRILYLNKEYKTLCEEMEGIAVYQIANQHQIPVIDIRVISNNEVLGEKYDITTGKDLQVFIKKLVKEYIKEEIK